MPAPPLTTVLSPQAYAKPSLGAMLSLIDGPTCCWLFANTIWLLNGTAPIPPGIHGFANGVVQAATDDAEIVYVWFGISSPFASRLSSMLICGTNSYRSPKFTVSLGVTFHESCTYPAQSCMLK